MHTHPGCTIEPSFGVEGTKKREFCVGHAKERMINLKINRRKCTHPSCTKEPSFGIEGTKKTEFCAGHAKEGMIDLKNINRRRCTHPSCTKRPPFGAKGTQRRYFCAGHAKDGIVHVQATADGGWCGRHDRVASAIPCATGVSSIPRPDGRGSGGGGNGSSGGSRSSSSVPRVQESLNRKVAPQLPLSGAAAATEGAAMLLATTDRDRASSNIGGGSQRGALFPSPAVQLRGENSSGRVGTRRSPPDSQVQDDTDSGTTRVKMEDLTLPSSLLTGGDDGTPSSRVGSGPNKREGRASPPAGQAKTSAGSGSSSSSNGSGGRGRGKRARRAVDDAVVLLEPGVRPAVKGKTTEKKPRAMVAIKPER